MSGPVLLFAETDGGAPKAAAFELATAAASLAGTLSTTVAAAVVGEGSAAAAAELGRRGVTRVYAAEDPALSPLNPEAVVAALRAVVAAARPAVVLVSGGGAGRDVAPALAAALDAACVSDAIELTAEGGRLRALRPIYAGKVRAAVEAPLEADRPVVVAVRGRSFPEAAAGAGEAEVVPVPVDLSGVRTIVKEVRAPEVRRLSLTEADVVVAGGRGLKGPEHFHLVEELAAELGAAVGATRAIVDAGWRPHAEQVGQTGKTVAPKLYVAIGISGAIQHLAGMSSSQRIVAVNKDPEAPIFKVADYGIVGDALEVIPALLAALRARRSEA